MITGDVEFFQEVSAPVNETGMKVMIINPKSILVRPRVVLSLFSVLSPFVVQPIQDRTIRGPGATTIRKK